MEKMSVYSVQDKVNYGIDKQLVKIGNLASGFLTSEFKMSSSPNYETIMDFGYGKFKILETAMKVNGTPIFQSTEFMNRFYSGGNYLSFPLEFKVVDYDGDNLVRTYAKNMIRHTLPNRLDIDAITDKIITGAKEGAKTASNIPGQLGDLAGSALTGELGENTIKGIQTGVVSVSDKARELQEKSGVGAIQCSVGDVLSGLFLLTNIDVTFSKEYILSKDGTGSVPMYGTFSVTLETPSIPNKDFKGPGSSINLNTSVQKRITER